MKVLHVVGSYPSPSNPHAQVFIKTQVESLIDVGVDCDVLLLDGNGPRKYFFGRPQVKRRLANKEYDLIHAHYAYCGFVVLGFGLPVVTSFLGSDLYGFPRADGSFPWFTKTFHIGLSRFVARQSQARIVKSEAMKIDLNTDTHVIPNGVNCETFKPVTREERIKLREEMGLKQNVAYALFAGNPELPRKRFGLAKAAVEKAAITTGKNVQILSLSGRPHSDVVNHMQACDFLILTSSLEGSPNVVKEAMATNMPVASVIVGDTFERLNGVSGCRLAKTDSVESIAEAVAELITCNEECGARAAVESLHMPLIAEEVLSVYKKAISVK